MQLSAIDGSRSFGGVDTVCQAHIQGLFEHSDKNEMYYILAFSPANDLPRCGQVIQLSPNIVLKKYNMRVVGKGVLKYLPNFIAQELIIRKSIKTIRPWLIHSHIPNWPIFKYHKSKKLLTLHSWGKVARENHGLLNNILHERVLQPLSLKFSDAVVTVSRDILKLIKKSDPEILIKYIPNPVAKKFFCPVKVVSDKKELTIIVSANITARKRINDCLNVLALVKISIPDVKLIIVGPYDEQSQYFIELNKNIVNLNLCGHVVFLGRLDSQELLQKIDISHIGLFMSENETFGLAPLEIMARGLPVIATSVGVMDWDGAILKEMGALIVQVGDIETAAQHIITLSKNMPPRRCNLPLKRRYSLHSYIIANQKIYEKLRHITD